MRSQLRLDDNVVGLSMQPMAIDIATRIKMHHCFLIQTTLYTFVGSSHHSVSGGGEPSG